VHRVTLDSNVCVSAFQFGGLPLRLIEIAGKGEIEIAVSEPILREVVRVLGEKFTWPATRLQPAESSLRRLCRVVAPTEALIVVKDDPDDDRVVECAVAAGSEVIITGDKHLLRLAEHRGIKILRAREFFGSQAIAKPNQVT
jgi:putative PIN family toxin of toxin-antitoxin system